MSCKPKPARPFRSKCYTTTACFETFILKFWSSTEYQKQRNESTANASAILRRRPIASSIISIGMAKSYSSASYYGMPWRRTPKSHALEEAEVWRRNELPAHHHHHHIKGQIPRSRIGILAETACQSGNAIAFYKPYFYLFCTPGGEPRADLTSLFFLPFFFILSSHLGSNGDRRGERESAAFSFLTLSLSIFFSGIIYDMGTK